MAKVRVSEVRAEHLITELLGSQGWGCRRPPNGEMLRQQEYKDHSHLRDVFRKRSKVTMIGDGLPEAVIVDRHSLQPLLVIEAKASIGDLDKAVREVTDVYGRACIDAGYSPLAVAVAGTTEDSFAVRVFKWDSEAWVVATYEGNPIGWIPNRVDAARLRVPNAAAELRPSVPSPADGSWAEGLTGRMIRTLTIAAMLTTAALASAQPVASIAWHDGDSGTINGTPFRLADVDAPETGGVGSRGGAKCEAERELGREAREFIIDATRGKALSITTLRTKDDYGRSVITLSASGKDVGALGVDAGHLRPWVFRGQRATTKKPGWC